MGLEAAGLFNVDVWRPALETYGAATRLTVELYGRDERLLLGLVRVAAPYFSRARVHAASGLKTVSSSATIAEPR